MASTLPSVSAGEQHADRDRGLDVDWLLHKKGMRPVATRLSYLNASANEESSTETDHLE